MFALGNRLLRIFSRKKHNNVPQPKPTQAASTNSLVRLGRAEELLSKEGIGEIVNFEVGGKYYYEMNLTRPIRPPTTFSGVTIGVGVDLGYLTREEFQSEWGDYLDDYDLMRLSKACGYKGAQARELLGGLKDISISYETAMRQFAEKTLPKWIKKCEEFWPRWDTLLPMQRAALLSLAFNRGTSLVGPRRVGMKQIVDCLNAGRLGPIPNIIRKMAMLHDLIGLQKRRHKEAILFEGSHQE